MRTAILLIGLLSLPFTAWGQQADNFPPDVTTVGQTALATSALPVVRISTGGQQIARRTDIQADIAIDGKTLIASTEERGGLRYYGWTAFTNSDKKAYRISLPKAGDFILQAPFSDRSLVRTSLLGVVAGAAGMPVRQPQPCELVVDNIYYGVYLLLPASAALHSAGHEAGFFLTAELAHFIDGYRFDDLTDGSLAFGNCDAYDAYRTDTWAWASNSLLQAQVAPVLVPAKWDSLMNDAQFRQSVKAKWLALRAGALADRALSDSLDTLVGRLTASGAAARNHEAWPRWGQTLWPNYSVPTSYDDEVDTLRARLSRRLEWMDENIGKLGEKPETLVRQCTPLTVVSGFNTDCIAESDAAAPRDKGSHPALDGHGSVFTTAGVADNARAIPDDGLLTGNGLKFQLGDFAADNCLYLAKGGESGTLAFSTACRADSIALLTVGTNRGYNYDLSYSVALHYADGTTANAGSFTVGDWAFGGDFSFYRWRADNGGGSLETNQAYAMSVQLLPCDNSRALSSVTVSSNCRNDTWGYGMVSVFAVTAINEVSSGVDAVSIAGRSRPTAIYDAAGIRRNGMGKGLNIVRYGDGRVVKVMK